MSLRTEAVKDASDEGLVVMLGCPPIPTAVANLTFVARGMNLAYSMQRVHPTSPVT